MDVTTFQTKQDLEPGFFKWLNDLHDAAKKRSELSSGDFISRTVNEDDNINLSKFQPLQVKM